MELEKREKMAQTIVAALLNIDLDQNLAKEVAFHLSDWTENLEEIMEVYERGEQMSYEQINQVIFTFLAHVPNHLAAAKKLIGLGPIEDVFNLGVTEEDS